MANTEEVEAARKLREALQGIATSDIDLLAQRPALGEINFEAGRAILSNAIDLANRASGLQFESIGVRISDRIRAHTENLIKVLGEIHSFTISGRENPAGERDDLLERLRGRSDEFFDSLFPVYAALRIRQIDEEGTLGEAKTQADEYLREISNLKGQAEAVLQTVRETSGQLGVGKFSDVFKKVSAQHQTVALRWLVASIALIVGTIVAAYELLISTHHPVSIYWTSLVSVVGGRFFILSLLTFASVLAVKNYRNHRHLAVVNEHRQNALTTFQAFVDATDDIDTKNAVLLHAANCIFSQGTTGYIGSDEASTIPHVVEVLRTMTSKAD